MSTTTPKRVHFKNKVSKFSVDGTPSMESLINQTTDIENDSKLSKKQTIATTNSNNQKENDNLITVGIRIRPLNRKELSSGSRNILQTSDDDKKIYLTDRSNNKHQFTCDYCFTERNSSQQYVYECIGSPLLLRSFDGYNVSVFAYGQTGSGKTYSMIGIPQDEGIIPRFLRNLFDKITQLQEQQQQYDYKLQIQCEISYYEIYNEKIYDLLRSNTESQQQNKISINNEHNRKHLTIRESPLNGPYIVDLLTISCENANDALIWFNIGNKRRATACTNMNDKSSRSHSVFQVNLKQIKNEVLNNKLQILTSKINLVDLAGSERLNNLQQQHQHHQQSRFKESTCINKSLLTLGKIICILSERSMQQNASNTQGNGYLPYRESALTWLLKESLGGNSKTSMLATINCSSNYLDETLSTLRYASKTACIKNTAMLNRDLKFDVNELEALKKEHLKSINEIELIKREWKYKLDDANKRKEEELKNLEKSLIIFYEKEKCSQNCCLINLNEDPSLSEKLIYLIKSSNNDASDTVIGSEKQTVDIYLSGPLIAPIHAKICKSNTNDEMAIEQLDKNYVTYVNGELVSEKRHLYHGDRIIFGGSHYFRLNNPKLMKSTSNLTSTPTTPLTSNLQNIEFKDYLFAKTEMENKQSYLLQLKYENELNKRKEDGELKIKEMSNKYEQDIEKIKNDLENEKLASKQQIEQIRCESAKKFKKMFYKNLKLETKLNLMEAAASTTNSTLSNDSAHSASSSSLVSTMSSSIADNLQTPTLKADELKNKVKTVLMQKWMNVQENINEINDSIIERHHSNSAFNLRLKLNEINKILNVLKLNYEFELREVYDVDKRLFMQVICCVNKVKNLEVILNFNQVEDTVLQLREAYTRFIEDNEEPNEEALFDELFKADLSPQVIDDAMSKSKACKRRLSLNNSDEVDSTDNQRLNNSKASIISTASLLSSNLTIDNSSLKKFKGIDCYDNKDEIINTMCLHMLQNLINLKQEQKSSNEQRNILDDNFYLTCNQLDQFLNQINRYTGDAATNARLQCTTSASVLFYMAKEFYYETHLESNKRHLIADLDKEMKDFIENFYNFLNDNESTSFKSLEICLKKLTKVNGQIKFYRYKDLKNNNISLDYNYKNFNLELLKYYLFGVYIEYNEFIEKYIQMVLNVDQENDKTETKNSIQPLKESLLKFMEILESFRVDEFENFNENIEAASSTNNGNLLNENKTLIQNLIKYANYMFKTYNHLHNTLKLLNFSSQENHRTSRGHEKSVCNSLIQNFDSILTGTLSIQIINQTKSSVIGNTSSKSTSQHDLSQSVNLNNEFMDKLIYAFKNLANSLKSYFSKL